MQNFEIKLKSRSVVDPTVVRTIIAKTLKIVAGFKIDLTDR